MAYKREMNPSPMTIAVQTISHAVEAIPRGGRRMLAGLRGGLRPAPEATTPPDTMAPLPGATTDRWGEPIVERATPQQPVSEYAPCVPTPRPWRSPVGLDSEEYAREVAYWARYGRRWPA